MSGTSTREALAEEYERYPGVDVHYEGKFARIIAGRVRADAVRELASIVRERDRRLSGLAARVLAQGCVREEIHEILPSIVELVKSPERMNADAVSALSFIAYRYPEEFAPTHDALWSSRVARHRQAAMFMLRFATGRRELCSHLAKARIALLDMDEGPRQRMFGLPFLGNWPNATMEEAQSWAEFLKWVEQQGSFSPRLRGSMLDVAEETASYFAHNSSPILIEPFVGAFILSPVVMPEAPWRSYLAWGRLLTRHRHPFAQDVVERGLDAVQAHRFPEALSFDEQGLRALLDELTRFERARS